MTNPTIIAPFDATTTCLGEEVADIILAFFFQTIDKAIDDKESAVELFRRYIRLGIF